MTWEQILAELAKLPAVPLDADEQLEAVLRKEFNFYDDREAEAEQFPDQETWGPFDHYGS